MQEIHLAKDRYGRILARVGDPRHLPRDSITESGATTEPEQRGHLLRLVKILTLLMVSGRFKRVGAPPPLTTKKTIVGYLILHIVVFTEVVDCRIYHETIKTPDCFGIDCYGIGSDQKLMSLTLTLPYHDSKKKR